MEYVGLLPMPQSKTTCAHYISYKSIGHDFIRHDDRRAYMTRIEGEYKAYLIFYRQAGVEANINTMVIPPEINLPVCHKTRILNRANPSATIRGPRGERGAGVCDGRGRAVVVQLSLYLHLRGLYLHQPSIHVTKGRRPHQRRSFTEVNCHTLPIQPL